MKLAKHSIYNLIGLGLPLLVAIYCIPILIKYLGDEKFGLLTLIWAVVSYFGLFDFGLGRALTQKIAVAISDGNFQIVGNLIGSGIVLMAFLGLVAATMLASICFVIPDLVSNVTDSAEVINSIYIMAVAMPFVVMTAGFRGILEAANSFAIINIIRLPMGLLTFVGPVAVIMLGWKRLDVITVVLAAGRIVGCAAHGWFVMKVFHGCRDKIVVRKKLFRPLLISGGWVTVSNIVSPLMGYLDRFLIGGVLSAAAVAYYVTPQEIVSKLSVIPSAITSVLFPKFAASSSKADCLNRDLAGRSVFWIYLITFPICLILAIFSEIILTAWVGDEFSKNCSLLMKIFTLGTVINCIAHVPFSLIQGSGKPKITALIHCLELPFFAILLFFFVSQYGIIGAAFAWLIRISIDSLLLFWMCSLIFGWGAKYFISRKIILFTALTLFSYSAIIFY